MHLKVLKSVPKSRCFKQNFAGRANLLSLGQVKLTIVANQRMGCDNECGVAYIKKHFGDRQTFHKEQKKSVKYKAATKRLRVVKRCLTFASSTSSYAIIIIVIIIIIILYYIYTIIAIKITFKSYKSYF